MKYDYKWVFESSTKDIDDLEKIILSCSGMKAEDSAISIILIEEMLAYFTGQKALDFCNC